MGTITLQVELTQDIYLALQSAGLGKKEMEARAARELAVQLYADGRLSLGKAAKLAGMTTYDFWSYLVEKKIPVFEYTEEDFDRDQDMTKDYPLKNTVTKFENPTTPVFEEPK